MNEQDNFLLPQALPCLAAVLRQDGIQVSVLDCMPEKAGWATLARRIRDERPQVVAAGENHAVYASEVVRLVHLAKEIDPSITTVLGGAHFTNTGDLYLHDHPIDFIVRGEGEITLLEFVRALDGGGRKAARAVQGISYRSGDEIITTAPRNLVPDLDALPMPAYDLLPMDRYGSSRYLFSPGGTTIHHSRGCTARCRFCVWWTQMAHRTRHCKEERLAPRWRTRSVERTLEEMELLYRRFGKRCLVFTDPTFNLDPEWNEQFADALIRKNWDLTYFAFLRADCVLRDEKLGIFEKLVRSGLIHVCIGVERVQDEDLKKWGKPFYSSRDSHEVFRLLKERYPRVVRQATFILGTRDESRESMQRQLDFARLLDVDYPAFHVLTPFPGTDLWHEAREKGWLEIEDFDYFDLSTPLMGTDHLTREEVEEELIRISREYITPRRMARGLLSGSSYRRNLYIWFLLVSGRIFADAVRHRMNPFAAERYTRLVKPDWYDG